MSVRSPRYCGIIPHGDPLHYTLPPGIDAITSPQTAGTSRIVAPRHFKLKDGTRVSQWSKTVESRVTGFSPAKDCNGNFMSYKYQPNNNCYNYACNIATNSFAQPGRRSGRSIFAPNGRLTAAAVIEAAKGDGLIYLGGSEKTFQKIVKELSKRYIAADGHLVALLVSAAKSAIHWKGDYHWVRCDDFSGPYWSHKDGPDQVANFDFSGNAIKDPSKCQWIVNLGPAHFSGTSAKKVSYTFQAWMFVPYGEVKII
jgi:hypothetical protein